MPGRSPELRALQKPQKEHSVEESWGQVGLSWEQLLSKVTLPAPLAEDGELGCSEWT